MKKKLVKTVTNKETDRIIKIKMISKIEIEKNYKNEYKRNKRFFLRSHTYIYIVYKTTITVIGPDC